MTGPEGWSTNDLKSSPTEDGSAATKLGNQFSLKDMDSWRAMTGFEHLRDDFQIVNPGGCTLDNRLLAQAGTTGIPSAFGSIELYGEEKSETNAPERIAQVHRENPDETFAQSLARLHSSDVPAGAQPGIDFFDVNDFASRQGVKDAASMSPHLAATLQELRDCKWAKDVHVWKRHPLEFTDYSSEFSRIEIDSNSSYKRQIEVLAHEGYHATHQDLSTLYGGAEPIGETQYVDLKMQQEAGAFLREIEVNEELRKNRPDLGNQAIDYMWVDPKNPKEAPVKQIMNDLLIRHNGQIDEKASLQAIDKFLRHHPAAIGNLNASGYQKDAQGRFLTNDYVEHNLKGYELYSLPQNYSRNREYLRSKNYL